MQIGVATGRNTIDAIFVVMQFLEKYLVTGELLYLALVASEKAYDRALTFLMW